MLNDPRIEAATKAEWADRALRAEAKLRDALMDATIALGQAQEAYEAQLQLERRADKVIELLREALKDYDERGSTTFLIGAVLLAISELME